MSKYPIFELFVITLSYHLQQIHCRPALGSSINFIEDFYYWNSSDTRTYPWLKICSENKRFEIQPGAWCSKGIYFPDGFIPHCVCPFGLWAVKTRVCDMHTHFLLGDSRRNICYYIDFKIESILFLGDPNNVFASKAYVSPYQLNVFYEIPMDGSYTPKLDLDNALVIHMFPINNRSIETEDGNCFPMIQQNRANVPVHIWASSLRPTRYRVVDKCKNPLNFGFDDLVAPNMVFVRSNLINEIPVPKMQGCMSSDLMQCITHTTTFRPLVPSHTPRNHKALYYDLAKVTPDQKEKLRQSIPIDPFHSVELIEPAVGNFSKLLSGKAKEIELPILMDSEVFRKFLNLNQYQVLNQTVANLKNPRGRLETTDERELVEDILEDILNKDANILKMVSPSQSSDEDVEQEDNHFTENIYEKRDSNNEAAYHHSVSDFDHLDFASDETSETTAQGSHISIKKRSLFAPLPTVEENIATSIEGSNSNVPLALASNEEDIQYLDKAENPPFDFSLLIFPPNLNNTRSKHGFRRKFPENHKGKPLLGLCKGIHTPPECEDEHFRSNQGKHKKLEDDMEEIINGRARLADMMQRFNNATKKYGFFKHISSMFNKSVDLLCETCVIPVKVVTKESIKDALHLLLVGLDVNELKIGYRSRRISSEIIMKNGNRFLKACRNGSGLIDFLFEEKCPPRVSCIKYTTGSGLSMQVISSLQNFLWPQMNVLSATLEAVTQFIRFMCKSNFPEMNEIANEFTRISILLLKAEESKINPVLKLNEKVIQSFLKIPSLPTYLTLLSKCVSAAATISFNMENKEYPTFKMETKRRPKRSPVKPLRLFDGIAICMDSYWDGVNEDHKCVPPPV